MSFTEEAKALRRRSPLTLREIGEKCNVSESMVSRYISGMARPPEEVAGQILDVLRDSAEPEERTADGDARIEDLWRFIRQQQIEKRIMFGVIVFLLLLSIALYIDATHGNWGFFRYTTGA